MGFFKQNLRLISQLFINQIGMTIFGIVLTMAVNMAAKGESVFLLGVSLFAALFYLALIYNVMWDAGARNIIRIENGRLEKTPFFALKASFFASVPNLFLAFLMLLGFLLGYVFEVPFGALLYGIVHIIAALFEAMYVGCFNVILDRFSDNAVTEYLVATLLYIFSSLPMILVSIGAYELGTRNIYLFGKKKPKAE